RGSKDRSRPRVSSRCSSSARTAASRAGSSSSRTAPSAGRTSAAAISSRRGDRRGCPAGGPPARRPPPGGAPPRARRGRPTAGALLALEARAGAPGTAAPVAGSGAVAPPPGRVSVVEAAGESIQVQTEAENKPTFTITTVVTRGGQAVRKTERSWDHPLQRED